MHCGAEVTESSTNKQHHLSLPLTRRGGYFPPKQIDKGFLGFVVVGCGRHPAEMKPHCSITPLTTWKGDFAFVETNFKLFTSTRRPSQRKRACGSPQHIPNCRPKSHHHLKINEGPVRWGHTQPTQENASSRPANPERASPRPPTPTKSQRDFAVAHHQNTIHPGGRRRVLKDLGQRGVPRGNQIRT
jgi:hypothetical protein